MATLCCMCRMSSITSSSTQCTLAYLRRSVSVFGCFSLLLLRLPLCLLIAQVECVSKETPIYLSTEKNYHFVSGPNIVRLCRLPIFGEFF